MFHQLSLKVSSYIDLLESKFTYESHIWFLNVRTLSAVKLCTTLDGYLRIIISHTCFTSIFKEFLTLRVQNLFWFSLDSNLYLNNLLTKTTE